MWSKLRSWVYTSGVSGQVWLTTQAVSMWASRLGAGGDPKDLVPMSSLYPPSCGKAMRLFVLLWPAASPISLAIGAKILTTHNTGLAVCTALAQGGPCRQQMRSLAPPGAGQVNSQTGRHVAQHEPSDRRGGACDPGPGSTALQRSCSEGSVASPAVRELSGPYAGRHLKHQQTAEADPQSAKKGHSLQKAGLIDPEPWL